MSKKLTTRTNDVLDTDKITTDGNILELGGNVGVESIEQIGVNVPKYNYMDVVTDTQFKVPTQPLFILAKNVTEVTEVSGVWSDTSPSPYNPPEGSIVYFNDSGLFYKINGQKRFIAFDSNGALEFKGELTDDGKKYIGYTEKGGFKPFFTEQQYQALLNLIK